MAQRGSSSFQWRHCTICIR